MTHQVTFWGTRGSIPTPGPGTARYGGNTACISVTGVPGRLVILDAGSGLRPLGHELMKQHNGLLTADILLSHTHWDHIQGLPFFKPLSTRDTAVCIYGAAQEGVALKEILGRQMDPMVFPVPLNALAASLMVVEIEEGEFEIDDFRICAFRLRHPGTTLGYRLAPREGGREVAYVTDNELGPGGNYEVAPDWRGRMIQFIAGADTLIHDAMYLDQIIQARAGWGHSTPRQAVDLAQEGGCRRLILFHHEPEHDDNALDNLLADTRQYAKKVAPRLQVEAAIEGMTFSL
ncbi:MAG TPA: MBL fold metallo-hydrolase [Gemmatimonadales bacterium]|nr:MBL fold metallo-hydrolase [Gemmatimonadales bacterium]